MTYTVATLIGSLRRESFTRKIANAFIALAPESLAFQAIEIGALPLYSQDLEDAAQPPPEWVAFRERVRAADALLFATPEYTRDFLGKFGEAFARWVSTNAAH